MLGLLVGDALLRTAVRRCLGTGVPGEAPDDVSRVQGLQQWLEGGLRIFPPGSTRT